MERTTSNWAKKNLYVVGKKRQNLK